MLVADAIGLGAGTQVFTHLPWFLLVDGWPGEFPRAVMMDAGWAINMVVAEWIIRRPHAMVGTTIGQEASPPDRNAYRKSGRVIQPAA